MPDDKRNGTSYSDLKKMSVNELEELLQHNFSTSDAQEPDVDFIMTVMEVIQEKERGHADRLELDADAAWQDFTQQYQVTTEHAVKGHEQNLNQISEQILPEKKTRGRIRLRRSLGIAAVAAVLFSVLLVSVSGVNVFKILGLWSEEYFQFIQTEKEEEGETKSFSDPFYALRSTVSEYTNLALIPTWGPEDAVLQRVQIDELEPFTQIHGTYLLDGEDLTISLVIYHEGYEVSPVTHEKDDELVMEYMAGGVKYFIMSNVERNRAIWAQDGVEGSISGPVTQEELLKMVDSIYEEQ